MTALPPTFVGMPAAVIPTLHIAVVTVVALAALVVLRSQSTAPRHLVERHGAGTNLIGGLHA
ncbi:hypothetical protein SEA_NERGAL_82 [Mycobacterium Phage Nergal]|nr:hypothetical protein SEA_NERGAL_82 [Mycobacterium Phage Nergal]